MVASTLKFTRIYWRTNALVLLLVHLEEYLDWLGIRTFLWRMSGISF